MVLSTAPVLADRQTSSLEALIPNQDQYDDRLGAYLLRAGAGMTVSGPDPRGSGGQYYLVMNGGLTFKGADYPLWSLLFIGPNDEACTFTAGAAGVEVFIGQYPRRD